MEPDTMLVSILVETKLHFQAMKPSCDKYLTKLNYSFCYMFHSALFMKRLTID